MLIEDGYIRLEQASLKPQAAFALYAVSIATLGKQNARNHDEPVDV